ncbi:TetR/AcrR family transcriptional regulator [Patulibacter sp. SYSU D01012]|uniref:TetR/AcrR family transcriptional regulator n=1 Tax=Patulibacter sp. SYSU D01012 TaxID=2817381 RepID=UPI001B303F05|nr:TetR/AcrR family transcriptional regulator [Patulibacter sp. SYSU D01012]
MVRRDAQRNRSRIVAAARAVLGRDGADAPLDRVVRAAEVGSTTFYRHFPTRAVLLEAVLDELAAELGDDAARAPDDPWAAFVAAFCRADALSHADAALLDRLVRSDDALAARWRTDAAEALAAPLRRAQDAGVVRPDVTADAVAELARGLHAAPAGERDVLRDVALRGLAGPPRQAAPCGEPDGGDDPSPPSGD